MEFGLFDHLDYRFEPPSRTYVERLALIRAAEQAGFDHALAFSAVGSPDTVRQRLEMFVDVTQADELIVTAQIFEHAARLHSYDLVHRVREEMIE